MTPRPWGFWTQQKLDMLADYLAAFTRASTSVGTTVYLDLFAGATENEAQHSRQPIEGSPIRALRVEPPLTKLVLYELPPKLARSA